jgi:NAD+ synthetase
MHPELESALARRRACRRFDAARYVELKASLLDAYLRRSGLRACVVAVSGGVDSAVTLALVRQAARLPGSPLARVVAALIPFFVPDGATHQHTALARGREVASAFDAEITTIDLSLAHAQVMRAVEEGLGVKSNAWAAGQLVSNLRTPAIYHTATLLTQQGTPALVCGTTNRDEGSYLGFFGKASDGMVDLQLISDLHKSEVYQVGRLLGVPPSVLSATPTGDTFDGRPDEAMIGAPYDFVELYTGLLGLDPGEQRRLRASWSEAAREEFARYAAAVEALHRVNKHKYLGQSPAVHLDVMERAVPGGWRADPPRPGKAPDPRNFVGLFALSPGLRARITEAEAPREIQARPLLDEPTGDLRITSLLDPEECRLLRDEALRHPALPADEHGRAAGFDPARGPAASWRSSFYDEELARALWARMAPLLPPLLSLDPHDPTDAGGHLFWRATGVSPLFRVIRYEPGGWLVPHHDAAYDGDDGLHRTLKSVLLHLTDPGENEGGTTAFHLDRWRHLPPGERAFEDGEAPAHPWEILTTGGDLGSALVFDHRLRHEGRPLRAGQKIVLRTDLVYARCGAPALLAPPSAPPGSPLGQRLGVPPGAPREQIDRAYREAMRRGEGDALRLAWKVLRDPFYGRLSGLLTTPEELDEAGFFDDGGGLPEEEDPRQDPAWWATPLGAIEEQLRASAHLPPSRPRVVLLSTGAYCPIHEGHVRILELAREALERQGAVVLGGYLSPSHDRYVQRKCGATNPGAARRVWLCEEALRGHPWLRVDPWESLHTDVPLNFTEVIDRLERFLSFRLRTTLPVRVAYVFGGDNARFALSFALRGRGVCVARPGHEAPFARYRGHPLLRENSRVLFAEVSEASLAASSTRVREQGELGHIPERARGLWASWSERRSSGASGALRLLLRDEGTWSLEPWMQGRDPKQVLRAWEAFLSGLQGAFREAFQRSERPLVIEVMTLAEQRRRVAEAAAGRPVISLDPCIEGDINLGLSRVFPVAGGEDEVRWGARPGEDLERQIGAIRPGAYLLLDDDTASGETRARAVNLLEARGIQLLDFLTSAALTARPGPEEAVEICDARDFLAGSRGGGLVVALPGEARGRVPYALPCARPSRRASIPPEQEARFSRAVWELNAAFFAGVSPPIRVKEASPAFLEVARAQRFEEQAPLGALCRWYAAGFPQEAPRELRPPRIPLELRSPQERRSGEGARAEGEGLRGDRDAVAA